MDHLSNHLIGIDSGEVALFSDFDSDGPMWNDTGARSIKHRITFSESFRKPPVVQVSIAMWDINSAENNRGELIAQEVTSDGFILTFKTWRDTKIARMRATWMAIGQLGYSDDWQVDQ